MTDLYLFPQQDFDVVLRANAAAGGQSSSGTASVAGGGEVVASGLAAVNARAIRRSLTIKHPYIERHYGSATVGGGGVPIIRGTKGASSAAIGGGGGDVLTMARRGPSRSRDEEDLLLLIA